MRVVTLNQVKEAPVSAEGLPATANTERKGRGESDGSDKARLTLAEAGAPASILKAAAPLRTQRPPSVLAISAGPHRLLSWVGAEAPAWLMGAVSIAAVLLVWHLATYFKVDLYVRFTNIPSPLEVWHKVLDLNKTPRFVNNIGASMTRILGGFAAATVLGVAMGMIIGRYRWVRHLTMPALEVVRPIPAIAWVPMSVMLWPSTEVSIVFITFLGAFFPILLNTIHGVEAIDPVLLRAARSLGAREPTLLREVILPGALPHIFTGLAVGMGVAWVSLIAAEMISGQFGIGYFTWEAYSLISYPEVALGMITIGVLGLLCSGAIRLAARIAMPWMTSSPSRGRA